jgi:hypothetical protein
MRAARRHICMIVGVDFGTTADSRGVALCERENSIPGRLPCHERKQSRGEVKSETLRATVVERGKEVPSHLSIT